MAGQSTVHPDIRALWRRKNISDALMGAAVAGAGYKGITWGAKKLGLIEDTPEWLDWSLPAIAGLGVYGYNSLRPSNRKAFIDTFNRLSTEGVKDTESVSKAILRNANFPLTQVANSAGANRWFPVEDIAKYTPTNELKTYALTLPSALLGGYYAHNMGINPALGFLGAGIAGSGLDLGWDKAQRGIYDKWFTNPMANEDNALKYVNQYLGSEGSFV